MSRDGTDPVALDSFEMDGSELLGTVVDGRYHLEAMLGRGGMGLVYRAAHVGLRRQVAVKILHPSLAASSDVRNRFEREALAVGRIDHPNCVSVYDVGRLPDGSLYLAMELLEGRALGEVLEREGTIAPGRALHILAHILRGLAHIHNAGLIHRDIKPENIFLIRQGSDEDFAKILDFGIAKPMEKTQLDDGVKLTQAGMAFGTPIYMAPEQALGNPMDGRADLYAAAVIGYEMLCGQPPFYSDDKLEVMSMHTAKPVPPMRTRMIKNARGVPSSIERLIVKGLTKKPGERYPNAEVFLAAVEDALKTPDGGVTDVSFEKPSSTGSQPLVTEDGKVKITGAAEFVREEPSENIADAIDDVLASAPPPVVPRTATPPRGLPPQVAAARSSPAPFGGGVGLGLPYTGPQGEPIFGLTPEQRLAQTNASLARQLEPDAPTTPVVKTVKRNWWVYGGIATAAIAIGVFIAVLTVPSGSDGPDTSTPGGRALVAFQNKSYDEAQKILDDNAGKLDNDAQAQLVIGHMAANKNDVTKACKAYVNALALDGSVETSARMIQNLKAWAVSDNPAFVAQGFDVWIRTADPDAKTALLNALVFEKKARRQAVRDVVERHKVTGANWVASYTLDLEQEPTCAGRKAAIAKLRSLEDKAAIPALQRAIVKKGARGTPKGLYNWCVIDDLKAAVAVLQQKP
jgi:serine/threonine protein kinase